MKTLTVQFDVDLKQLDGVDVTNENVQNAVLLKLNSGMLMFLSKNIGLHEWAKNVEFNWGENES